MTENNEKILYLDTLHDYLFIKTSQVIANFETDISNLLNNIILVGRNTYILLFSNHFFIESSRIAGNNFKDFKTIISLLIPEKTNLSFFKIPSISIIEIISCQQLLRITLSSLKTFGLGIHHFFLPQRQTPFKSEYFGTIIYPSLFSYFTFSEMIESGYQLLMSTLIQSTYYFQCNLNNSNFLNGSLNDVEGIMFSSFFNGFPHFINSFCHFYVEIVNKNSSSFHFGAIHEFINKSLEYSRQYLTPYHVKIMKYVKNHRPSEFFLNFFMIRVLQNNLNLYLEGDFELKCVCTVPIHKIIESFKQCTINLNPSFRDKIYESYILKIINCNSFFSSNKSLINPTYNTYISGFDEEMIYSIMQCGKTTFRSNITQNMISDKSFKPYLIEITKRSLNSTENFQLNKEIERNLNQEIKIIKNMELKNSSSSSNNSINVNSIIEKNDRFILKDIKNQSKLKKIDKIQSKNILFREFKYNYCGHLMSLMCQTNDDKINERYYSIFKNFFIQNYENAANVIENYIDHRLNESHLNTMFLSFKKRQDILLNFVSSVITNSVTFSDPNFFDFACPEQYMHHVQYLINNSKSALMNPYFELMSFKEVQVSQQYHILFHQNQILQKYKEFFDSEKDNADSFIAELEIGGKRIQIINEIILILKNIGNMQMNDQLLIISSLISKIYTIAQLSKINVKNAVEKIFLYAHLKSESVAIFPTLLIYHYLLCHNELFSVVMDEFDLNIKKSIILIENAIIYIFLEKKANLQSLVRNFIIG